MGAAPALPGNGSSDPQMRATWLPIVLPTAVFCACLVGIYSRPAGFLATVWPVNAVMLGLLLRCPRLARPVAWISAFGAYLAADLLTGASLFKAVILNAANIVGVLAAYLVYTRVPAEFKQLRHPTSILFLILASAVAGSAAGVIGALANPLLFGGSATSGWTFWFATELVNYISLLPAILTAPAIHLWPTPSARDSRPHLNRAASAAPAAALLLTCVLALLVGGPGAIAFPVPALLWCGLVYPLFSTALLTLLASCWTLVAISAGYLPVPGEPTDQATLISVRIAVSLLALAPVMVASVTISRNELLIKLHELATRDQLTGTVNRAAFRQEAQQLLARNQPSATALMLDLDHFKLINDQYGHAGGDEVLAAFAQRVRSCLRVGDLFGRLGGEEFAILLPDCSQDDALLIAQRIRTVVAEAPFVLTDGRQITATASLGLARTDHDSSSVDHLLAAADSALYAAKAAGRNRVEISG